MAKIDILAPFILSFEGGYVNDPHDKGGATNKGVTIAVWRKYGYDKNGDGKINEKDVMRISDADAIKIMKKIFWDAWKADEIKDQSVANILVDWLWASGSYAITWTQRALGLKVDGKVGPVTVAAINKQPSKELFVKLHKLRLDYIDYICKKNANNLRYKKGWVIRINAIGYGSLTYANGKTSKF